MTDAPITAAARSDGAPRPRTLFLDRLRTVLCALVILYHAAITYTPLEEGWPLNLDTAGPALSWALLFFIFVNQSFFMGMFFLIAGYFTPGAVRRKGVGPFLRDRLVRLGLPTLAFLLVLGPLTLALAATAADGVPFWPAFWHAMTDGRLWAGPMWFAIALILFSAGYALFVSIVGGAPEGRDDAPLPDWKRWLAAALGVGVVSMLVRLAVPIGGSVPALAFLDDLGLRYFVAGLGYFPSYVFLFAVGCAAARHRWLERVERRHARLWGTVALGALAFTTFMFSLFGLHAAGLLPAPPDWLRPFAVAVIVPLVEPLIAWGAIAWLLWRFRTHEATDGGLLVVAGRQAFGAYIVHPPVLVGLAALTAPFGLPALLAFPLVGALAVLGSFGIAALLRRSRAIRAVV